MSVKDALKHCKLSTRLKNKIENNSTWEGAFYKTEELKLTKVELF